MNNADKQRYTCPSPPTLILLLGLLFCYTVNCSAQTDSSQSVFTRYTYPDGVLCSEGLLRNGQPDGIWKNYHPNGKLKSIGKRSYSQLDSIWTFYDEQGLLTQKISYQNGKKNGFAYQYNIEQNGKEFRSALKSKELYLNNKREGMAWYYRSNGKPERSIPYENDKKEGIGFGFTADSSVNAIYRYHNNELLSIEAINKTDSSGNKQGIWKTFSSDGTIQSEENFEAGKLQGYQKKYDRIGRIVSTQLYQDNNPIVKQDTSFAEPQEQITYYPTGEIWKRGSWRNGIAIGLHRCYSRAGQVIEASLYDNNGCLLGKGIVDDNGRRQGKWKDFDPRTELLIAEGNYKNDLHVGNWRYYYTNAILEQEGNFTNNLRQGVWSWYYPNTQLRRQQEFTNGQAEGFYREFDSSGTCIVEGNFVDNRRDGLWKITTGSVVEIGSYREGEKNGKWNAFYANKQLAYTGIYQIGKPHGKHYFYYENGTLEHREHYAHGRKIKKWFYYNQHNQLYIIVTYRNDEEKQIQFVDK